MQTRRVAQIHSRFYFIIKNNTDGRYAYNICNCFYAKHNICFQERW